MTPRRPAGFIILLVTLTLPGLGAAPAPVSADPGQAGYQFRTPSRDGIGKVYMDREISRVMGHLGAGWLERPERAREERTDLLLEALELEPDDTVVDLGAGTGYFSFPMARQVPDGRVLAVDIQPQMLAIIEQRIVRDNVDNVVAHLGEECDPRLEGTRVDVVLLVDAYHEFSCPREVMQAVVAALAPGGRVLLVEYRAEDPDIGIKPLHTMTLAQAQKEMREVGLQLSSVNDVLPKQHLMVFHKAGEPAD